MKKGLNMLLKETVCIISCDPKFQDGNARFTMVPLKHNLIKNTEDCKIYGSFLNLDVQVESRNCDIKKQMKIFSSNSTPAPTIIHINIYSKLYIRFYLRI